MAMPLMEFLNYMTLIKADRAARSERLNRAAKQGKDAYMAAVLEDKL
jgi:hypothetical protein